MIQERNSLTHKNQLLIAVINNVYHCYLATSERQTHIKWKRADAYKIKGKADKPHPLAAQSNLCLTTISSTLRLTAESETHKAKGCINVRQAICKFICKNFRPGSSTHKNTQRGTLRNFPPKSSHLTIQKTITHFFQIQYLLCK